jgi:hypothetical protein
LGKALKRRGKFMNVYIEEITNFLNTIQDYGINDGAGPEPKSIENKDIAT